MKQWIAILLTVSTLASLLACGAAPQKVQFENTAENRRQAILETALAFYYHDPYIQYESTPLSLHAGSISAHDNDTLPPEAAGFDHPLYTVCSNFAHKVTEQALGFRMMDLRSYAFITKRVSELAANDPLVVYKYGGEDGHRDASLLISEVQEAIEPGDILVWYRKTDSGHGFVYVGDLFETGTTNILESGGGHMDKESGKDKREQTGSILKQNFEEHNLTQKWVNEVAVVVILRPWMMDCGELTPAAQSRLRYPKMELWKKFSQAEQQDVAVGETLTMTVEITNHSKSAYENLTVCEPVPEGQTAANIRGKGKLKDGKVTWNLTVPAGETVTVGFDIVVTGKIGDTISFPAGLADDGIVTRAAEFRIGGKQLTEVQQAMFLTEKDKLQAIAAECTTATKFINRAYRDLFGVDVKLPAKAQELLDLATENVEYDEGIQLRKPLDAQTEEQKYIYNMLIPKHLSGRNLMPTFFTDPVDGKQNVDTSKFISSYWREFYRPGDVFIVYRGSTVYADDASVEAQLILDSCHTAVFYRKTNGEYEVNFTSFEDSVQSNKAAKFVIGLRPSQVGLFD